MALLNLITYPDELLRKRSREIDGPSARLNQLLDDMRETMTHHMGVGIAAVQVGTLWRVALVETARGIIELINPMVTYRGKTTRPDTEGCLSVPNQHGPVRRSTKITIQAFDRGFNKFTIELGGREAICAAHEIDHMDGILFIDHMLGENE